MDEIIDSYVGVWRNEEGYRLEITKVDRLHALASIYFPFGPPIDRPYYDGRPTVDMPARYNAYEGELDVELWMAGSRFTLSLHHEDADGSDGQTGEFLAPSLSHSAEDTSLGRYSALFGRGSHYVRDTQQHGGGADAPPCAPGLRAPDDLGHDAESGLPALPEGSRCPSEPWDDLDDGDFEEWEAYAELLENEEYPELVEYCERDVARHPEDHYAQIRLGDAYVLNGQHGKAIESMGGWHRRFPDMSDYQDVILDALFALGKTEDDYDWARKPIVLRIGCAVLHDCHEYLRPKRKPREMYELYAELAGKGYLAFSAEQLLQALANDPRFVVQPGSTPKLAQVRVRTKQEGRTRV
jgi:tetratricopeptide (TPR) repeat protein